MVLLIKTGALLIATVKIMLYVHFIILMLFMTEKTTPSDKIKNNLFCTCYILRMGDNDLG